MSESLGEALPKELARARKVLEYYVGERGNPRVYVDCHCKHQR